MLAKPVNVPVDKAVAPTVFRWLGLTVLFLTFSACGTGQESPTPIIEFGANQPYQSAEGVFYPVLEGDEMGIVQGTQGAYMVVLAFRGQNLTQPVSVAASLTVNDVLAGEVAFQNRLLRPFPSGWDYYFNLFLIVDNWESLIGQQGDLYMEVEDADGNFFFYEVGVNLVDGGSLLGG